MEALDTRGPQLDTLEIIMVTKIILELLAATPKLVQDVEAVVAELKSSEDGEQKLKDISNAASAILATIADALN